MIWGITCLLYLLSKGYWWIVPLLIIGAIGKLFNAAVDSALDEHGRNDDWDDLMYK